MIQVHESDKNGVRRLGFFPLISWHHFPYLAFFSDSYPGTIIVPRINVFPHDCTLLLVWLKVGTSSRSRQTLRLTEAVFE